ncbi:DUF3137 domain-containing protein [Clostridium estertheticum]|uniref:DUF3137 domain-containing protein n=2 Tax=Clostridium estertheticum TaxID=238834 RepID=A0A7Y3WTY9_9CLOT|nr:DUF3137 domain-containing protein [Clostridium estertheticum]NNU77518.1 DUF3137 domain-containing protein [Clostridium estertheticum]WBL49200.1 DUF3137 domain-containing protein [Clostridium estertheticum]
MLVLRKSKKEVWEQLSREINADYIEKGFFKRGMVEARVDNWIILFDTYSSGSGNNSRTYTRIRAPFKTFDSFHFKIYRKGLFSDLGKLLGMQDVSVGYSEFDENFIIKGTNSERLTQLFSNEKIRNLLELQSSIHLEVKDDDGFFASDFPDNVDELYFVVNGVIRDIERLKELYELFAEVLKELCVMSIASSEQVGIDLK